MKTTNDVTRASGEAVPSNPTIHDEALAMLTENDVSDALSKLLDAYKRAEAIIGQSPDGEPADADVDSMMGAALAVCGYRPLTKGDQRRKGEFLREYTKAALLTDDEQIALVRSLVREGDAVSPLSRDEFEDFLEGTLDDIGALWRLARLLSYQVYQDLDIRRAQSVEEDAITLLFQRDGIDISKWLAGEVAQRAVVVRDKIDAKLKEFDDLRVAQASAKKGGAQ